MLLSFSAFLQKATLKGSDSEVTLALCISEMPSSCIISSEFL